LWSNFIYWLFNIISSFKNYKTYTQITCALILASYYIFYIFFQIFRCSELHSLNLKLCSKEHIVLHLIGVSRLSSDWWQRLRWVFVCLGETLVAQQRMTNQIHANHYGISLTLLGLLNKSSCLSPALCVTKCIIVSDMILVTLCCAT
jgi:hypothetical protein